MATLLRVDPLDGCSAYPTSTKIQTGGGTLRSGSYTSLRLDDATYYQVNSTTLGRSGPTGTAASATSPVAARTSR